MGKESIASSIPNEAICPVCNMADQTQKVSAIVVTQTSSSSVSGYNYKTESSYHGRGTHRTELAKLLKKPSPPFHATVAADIAKKGFSIFQGAVAVFFLIATIILASIDLPLWCPGIFGVLALFMFISLILDKDDGPSAEQLTEITAYWTAEDRWKKSYYCYRCNRVFFSQDGIKWHNDASNFRKLLYGRLQ